MSLYNVFSQSANTLTERDIVILKNDKSLAIGQYGIVQCTPREQSVLAEVYFPNRVTKKVLIHTNYLENTHIKATSKVEF